MGHDTLLFLRFVGDRLAATLIKTLESLGLNYGTLFVTLVIAFSTVAVWARRHAKSKGVKALPAGAWEKVKAYAYGVSPWASMAIGLVFLFYVFRVDYDRYTALQNQNVMLRGQLNELEPLRGIQGQLRETQEKLAAEIAANARLSRQLDNSGQRRRVVNGLTRLSGQLANLRDKCNTIAPQEYRAAAKTLLEGGVQLLQQGGYAPQAQRLADGSPPAGTPHYTQPICEPYVDNSNVALSLRVRLLIIDGIGSELSR